MSSETPFSKTLRGLQSTDSFGGVNDAPDMLGRIPKETREAAGLTQEALADAASVDRSDISQLERDIESLTIQMLFRLCGPLKIRPSVIIARLEQQTP